MGTGIIHAIKLLFIIPIYLKGFLQILDLSFLVVLTSYMTIEGTCLNFLAMNTSSTFIYSGRFN